MTDTLTREQILEIAEYAGGGITPTWQHTLALCRLALKALDPPAPPSADVVEKAVEKALNKQNTGYEHYEGWHVDED